MLQSELQSICFKDESSNLLAQTSRFNIPRYYVFRITIQISAMQHQNIYHTCTTSWGFELEELFLIQLDTIFCGEHIDNSKTEGRGHA